VVRKEWAEFDRIAPSVSDAITAIGAVVKESTLEPELIELVKIRASQINGCAYCTQLHLNVARKLGMAPERLDLLAVWLEAGIYSKREAAALAWTELLTDVAHGSVAALTAAIIQINAWNRLGATYRMSPPIPRRSRAAASNGPAAS
jgi:AhpD family alkylhydroperoxidase